MATTNHRSLPPGRQPWDPANGFRAGAFAGGLVGAAVVALTGISNFWIVAVGGAIGGGLGYGIEKRKQRPLRDRSDRDEPPDR